MLMMLLCLLHTNASAPDGPELRETLRFAVENMEVVGPDGGAVGLEVAVRLRPGESTFTVLRAASLGRYSASYSRTIEILQSVHAD